MPARTWQTKVTLAPPQFSRLSTTKPVAKQHDAVLVSYQQYLTPARFGGIYTSQGLLQCKQPDAGIACAVRQTGAPWQHEITHF